MASLSWSTAARIASRELRSSRGKFLLVILSVAIGVAALTGVRGFSSAFRVTLLTRARSILAGDIGTRMFQQPTPEQQGQLDALSQEDIVITQVSEMASMAPAKYPFYGTVELRPSMPLAQALAGNNVAVGEDLLIRLHLKVGDSIRLGD